MNLKVSKFQALYKYFPERPWGTEFGTMRTLKMTCSPINNQNIKEDLAKLITPGYHKRLRREFLASKSKGWSRTTSEEATEKQPNSEDNRKAEEFLSALSGGSSNSEHDKRSTSSGQRKELSPDAIELYEINEESTIQSEVFPNLFICGKCNRYYYVDKNNPGKLQCNAHKGKPAALRQVELVFSCARCARIEPLLPFSIQYRNLQPGPVKCGNDHDITLSISGSLANARWDCVSPGCDYWKSNEKFDNRRLNRVCICHIPEKYPLEESNETHSSAMAPRPPASGEIASPLTSSYIQDVDGNELSLTRLRELHREIEGSFALSGLSPRSRSLLDSLGISEFFSVPEIHSITVNYGYTSTIRPQPPVPDEERYPKFFQTRPRDEKFKAYLVSVSGKGLIIGFDQEKLRLMHPIMNHSGSKSYGELATKEMEEIQSAPFQDLLSASSDKVLWPITKVLHAMEHALLSAFVQEIGIEEFDSRIIVEDGSIVIFETMDLGDGGIDRIAYQPDLVSRWIEKAIDKLSNCPQYCNDACIACIRSDNTSCHGFIHREFQRWMPPNVLLDRRLAMDFLKR